jgi:hypothetical protein
MNCCEIPINPMAQ